MELIPEFQELLDQLQHHDESERMEAKKSTDKVGTSALDTISSFANEPGLNGGYLFFGLTKNEPSSSPRYIVEGVADPDKIQNELATLCRQNFNVPIRPTIRVGSCCDRPVVIAHIPEAEPYEKPVYIKSKGKEKGAFRRIGSSDQLCTQEDFNLFYHLRNQTKFDETVLDQASWADFDPQAIAAYRRYRKEVNPNAKELQWEDQELLLAIGAAMKVHDELKPTIAGIVLFGSEMALRRLFPTSTRIDYLIVSGKEWTPTPETRYLHSYEFREALLLAIPRLRAHIMKDIPNAFFLKPGGLFRQDIPLIPDVVIREALCNAVMHRDYSIASPIQIIRYANRLEFQNPGYSLKPEEQLGSLGSISRNEKIGAVLHDLNIAETKGTGIRTMQTEMKEANLSVPLFESNREANQFTLTLLSHHFFNEKDLQWLKGFSHFNLSSEEALALLLVREMGAITNQDYRNINHVDTLAASTSLRKLRDLNLLESKGKGSRTYYVPGPQIVAQEEKISATPLPTELTPLPTELTPLPTELPVKTNRMSRLSKKDAEDLILNLCKEKPQNLLELSKALGRNPSYTRTTYLPPLIKAGKLTYSFPDQPNHPRQTYKTAST